VLEAEKVTPLYLSFAAFYARGPARRHRSSRARGVQVPLLREILVVNRRIGGVGGEVEIAALHVDKLIHAVVPVPLVEVLLASAGLIMLTYPVYAPVPFISPTPSIVRYCVPGTPGTPGTPLARDRRPDYDRGELKFLSVLDSASLYWFSLLSKRFLPKSL